MPVRVIMNWLAVSWAPCGHPVVGITPPLSSLLSSHSSLLLPSPHTTPQLQPGRAAGRERWELNWADNLTGSQSEIIAGTAQYCSVLLTSHCLSHTVSLSVNSPLTTSLCSRYQNELPKKIKSRGKESHLTHEELVQLIKWKLAVSFSYNSITDRLSDWLTDYQELQSQQDFYLFILISNRHLERSLPSQIKGLDTNEHPQGCHARNQKGVQGYW